MRWEVAWPGELNEEAVASVKSFTEFPLVWLGEEFQGHKLTAFIREKRVVIPAGQLGQSRDVVQDSVGLIYGTCVPERSDDGEGPSCVAPLSIILSAPGTVPPPEGVAPEVAGSTGNTRGLTSKLVSGSTMLWAEDGITITVHANTDVRADALRALRLANAGKFGLADIGPDESLAPLKGLR